jgi:hypothetical protein
MIARGGGRRLDVRRVVAISPRSPERVERIEIGRARDEGIFFAPPHAHVRRELAPALPA